MSLFIKVETYMWTVTSRMHRHVHRHRNGHTHGNGSLMTYIWIPSLTDIPEFLKKVHDSHIAYWNINLIKCVETTSFSLFKHDIL